MEKIIQKLPKNVFDQIEAEKAKGNWWKERVAKKFLRYQLQDCPLSFDVIMSALLNGYEVEETPEDKVKELYDYYGQPFVQYAGKDIQNKIQIILTTLGFKIDGINS